MNDLTGSPYCIAVDISCMFMSHEDSPAMSITRASGWATWTPIAAGKP